MNKDNNLKPFVKWAGGKRQLLTDLKKYIPKTYNEYYEPFIGGGALLFNVKPKNAHINDLNKELIIAYKVIANHPEQLQLLLDKHQQLDNKEYYYSIRKIDRDGRLNNLNDIERAARFIYLNKSCFNGL